MESQKEKKPSLADQILHWGQLGYDPRIPPEDRAINQSKFTDLIERTGVLALMPVLNFLIQPGRAPAWLRQPLISALALLPLRQRGVQNTIEFVCSVHPSNSRYDGSVVGKKGAGMSHEALNAASRLLSTAPNGVSPERWFSLIAPQLFSLLQGGGEAEMERAAAFIIGFGILGRKQYGGPGMPGWKAFAEPMLKGIDPSIAQTSHDPKSSTYESIVTLGATKVLVPSNEVANSIERLTALVTAHPNPSLTKRLLEPILLPLWSLSSWQRGNEQVELRYRKPATKLLKTLLQLSSSNEPSKKCGKHSTSTNLSLIIQNLTFSGRSKPFEPEWIFGASDSGEIQIQEPLHNGDRQVPNLVAIDRAADSFIELIKTTPDLEAEISNLFMGLCTNWLTNSDENSPPSILTHAKAEEPRTDIEHRLIEATVLQKMISKIPEKLVRDSQQVLNLVSQVLSKIKTSENGNENIETVALSLFNMILTSPNFRETPDNGPVLENIKKSLERIGSQTHLDISTTARNLVLLLKYRGAIQDPDTSFSRSQPDQQVEDRKIYSLAISYLTATDSPPPVRAQGLQLISGLIRDKSSVLDIPALLVLLSSLLQEDDEYIYLRAIRSFTQLSERHPKAVMTELVERYVDPNEDYELDQRLRLGEALLQVIESSKGAFIGEIASTVSQGLMSVAGRRGFRPKTEQAQERQKYLRRMKEKEAEDAWGGEVPQLDEILENESQEDYEIVSRIVAGWESKRGTEDVRMRASALSILAAAIESNISGIGSKLISSMVDLSIHILTLERGPEKGILRRSAVLLILSFVRALDLARIEGRKIGFGFVGQSLDDVQRILEYVRDTDSDGLARKHASDVVESLQAWQMNVLLPLQNNQMGLQELAGLAVTPGDGSNFGTRPRIEEIE